MANGKHANYPSQTACDAGNGGPYLVQIVFSYDTCEGNNSFLSATVGANRNLGSSQVKFLDCVASTFPFYQDPPHPNECFWTGTKFVGWQIDQTTYSSPYKTVLSKFGY